MKKDDQVLLGYKKRGFGVGTWNGFGGKVEEGESIRNGALRWEFSLISKCRLQIKRSNEDFLESAFGSFWYKLKPL